MNTNTGGPAFNERPEQAFPSTFKSLDGEAHIHAWGMTLRQYAAIKLKVPDSGTDWLDDMIRKSNEIDMMIFTSQQQSNTL